MLKGFYNFSNDDPGPDWDKLTKLGVFIATPRGVGKYLKKLVDDVGNKKRFFFGNLLIVHNDNHTEHLEFVKHTLENLKGKTEKELIFKAMRLFSWEYEDDYYGGIDRLL